MDVYCICSSNFCPMLQISRHQEQFHEGLVVFLLDQAQGVADLRAHEAVHGLDRSLHVYLESEIIKKCM